MRAEAEPWTREREVMLAQLIEAGRDARLRLDGGEEPRGPLREIVAAGVAARETFITENLPFVRHRVRRLIAGRGSYEDESQVIEELVAEAIPALINAVDRFDWRRGCRFSTFAGLHIDGAIKRRFTKDRGRPTPSLAITEDWYW